MLEGCVVCWRHVHCVVWFRILPSFAPRLSQPLCVPPLMFSTHPDINEIRESRFLDIPNDEVCIVCFYGIYLMCVLWVWGQKSLKTQYHLHVLEINSCLVLQVFEACISI